MRPYVLVSLHLYANVNIQQLSTFMQYVRLRKRFLNLQPSLFLPHPPSVAPSPSVLLCVSVVWALSQVECVFLNEYLIRLMRLAGGGAVSVEY